MDRRERSMPLKLAAQRMIAGILKGLVGSLVIANPDGIRDLR